MHGNKAPHKPGANPTAAFTIVELLVVVAVLAVLASLPLPALSNAKRAVVRVHCKSNMKQWGIALQMYAGDANDYFPDNLDGYRIVYYGTNVQAFWRQYLIATSRSSTEHERNHVLFCPGDTFHRRWDTSSHVREGEPVGAEYLLLPHRDTTRRDWDYNVTGLEEWHSRLLLLIYIACTAHSAENVFAQHQIVSGTNLVGFPLRMSRTAIPLIFQHAPPGTLIYKWSDGGFTTNEFSGSSWSLSTDTVDFGDAVFVINPGEAFEITFAGELVAPPIQIEIPKRISAHGHRAFRAGGVTTDFGFNPVPLTNVYLWEGDRFAIFTYLPVGTWHPVEPVLSRGDGFFIQVDEPHDWHFTFEP